MQNTPIPDPSVAQLIDANLDRAREGLRVVEDWCRFGLNRKDLVITIKDWRQKLGIHHKETYKQARSTSQDQGLGLSHQAQSNRKTTWDVVAANCARAQEALRVIEEFGRSPDPELASVAALIRYGLYELELNVLEATNGGTRHKKLSECQICLITSPNSNLTQTVDDALSVGVGMVQYRSKNISDLQMFSEAKELADLCKKYKALFIINDRIDLALALDADGVHLGQKDFPVEIARQLIGSNKLIGRSTHSLQDINQAEQEGCDYLGVGPVHKTSTKPNEKVVGLIYVEEASKATTLPWFAIGGVNGSNIKSILTAGAQRIAVVGAIMNSPNPREAAEELFEAME
ncbi:thiamine phosphate synthase [Prochlorococcus sp. MIT 1300]|uniref:thiamine phosphate synthase n=1 Tax=Prochlorococcus sp. MIT 1300 TaxID=3096218 RepID=UPI002A74D1EC|nr:thiamine phosphate synthase [Prochlorococcus sp. MIT 1300]